jgi:hypothetical protein
MRRKDGVDGQDVLDPVDLMHHCRLVLAVADFAHLRTGDDLHTLVSEYAVDSVVHVRVLARQEALHSLEHRYLSSEALVGRGEFRAQVPAADDRGLLR